MNQLEGMHAIGYCRVSTDDKGQTTVQQRDAIEKWASEQGVILDSTFEEDMSGTVFPRPQLSTALVTLATTPASMLICYDQSRLTRDAEHHLPLIKSMIGKKVIRYVVNGDLAPDNMATQIMDSLKGITDKEERRVLSAKTKAKLVRLRDVENVHVGRPAVIVIADDVTQFRKGYISTEGKTKTIVYKPEQVLQFARSGWSPCYVAIKILRIPPATFYRALERAGLTEEYDSILKGVKA